MSKIEIKVQYFRDNHGQREPSHAYTTPWESTELYCPACGGQAVWRAADSGDHYVGEQHICRSCSATFYLPGGANQIEGGGRQDDADMQRLAALRAAG